MAAHHLPRDPERPSNGLKELVHTTTKKGKVVRQSIVDAFMYGGSEANLVALQTCAFHRHSLFV